MRYHIRYTDEAMSDLKEIDEFLEANLYAGPEVAARINREIRSAIDELVDTNFGHRYNMDPWYEKHVKTFTVKKYRVFYWQDKETEIIHILRVIHGARNVDRIMAGSAFPFVK